MPKQKPGKSRQDYVYLIGFVGYLAGVNGHIYSTRRNWTAAPLRRLAERPDKDGYKLVDLVGPTGKRSFRVHQLVAAAYGKPRPSLRHEVRHLDGDRENNSPDNLE